MDLSKYHVNSNSIIFLNSHRDTWILFISEATDGENKKKVATTNRVPNIKTLRYPYIERYIHTVK